MGHTGCSAIEYFTIFRYFKSKLLQLHIYIFVDSPGAGDPAPSRRWHISASETATSHGTGLRFIEYMYVFLLFFLFGDLELSQAISISSILRFTCLSNLAGFLVMFSLLAGAWQYMFEPREYYILILGIDNAGKTVRSYICNCTQYYTLNTVLSPPYLPLFYHFFLLPNVWI